LYQCNADVGSADYCWILIDAYDCPIDHQPTCGSTCTHT
jgi:hypothetical protein